MSHDGEIAQVPEDERIIVPQRENHWPLRKTLTVSRGKKVVQLEEYSIHYLLPEHNCKVW